ncbi:MAG: VRR-NUC domain-containing protein [Gammaproteobacteria bacterium]|nr:VRR-NUC domain-containing protein [Gammaproteobacteria bacterium]
MPQLAANRPPPPDYYAENLRQVLAHVRLHYADVLMPEEHAFAQSVLACSAAAQRLFARLIGRKGPWIRVDKVNYAEVDDLENSLDELHLAELISVNDPAPADALLGLLTNPERAQVFPNIAARSKPQWIERCVSRHSDAYIAHRIARQFPWVCVRPYPILRLYQLLFFGDTHQDLSTFVLEDLGMLRYESYQLTPEHRQFADRVALDRYLRLRALNALSHRVDEMPTLAPSLAHALRMNTSSRLEARVRDRALNRLGRWHERRGESAAALDCYGLSTSHPARERSARVLQRLGDHAGVEKLLCMMRRAPRSTEEEDFAERFGAPRQSSTIPTTEFKLDGAVPGDIEQYAIDTLTADRGRGWHLENRFSLGIAGLAFWPVIFADIPGAFVNPFQSAPVDLGWPDFLEPRADLLTAHLEMLGEEQRFVAFVRRTCLEKRGVANRLVSWRHFDETLLDAALSAIPAATLLSLAHLVLQNLHRLRTGFPDLLVVYGPGEYEFVEVKGPTDQLQPGQRIWFKELARLQLPARVVKFKS